MDLNQVTLPASNIRESVDSGVKIYFEHERLDVLCESLESQGFIFEHKPVDQS